MANRSTMDLVDELYREASGGDHAALFVGFENHTEFPSLPTYVRHGARKELE